MTMSGERYGPRENGRRVAVLRQSRVSRRSAHTPRRGGGGGSLCASLPPGSRAPRGVARHRDEKAVLSRVRVVAVVGVGVHVSEEAFSFSVHAMVAKSRRRTTPTQIRVMQVDSLQFPCRNWPKLRRLRSNSSRAYSDVPKIVPKSAKFVPMSPNIGQGWTRPKSGLSLPQCLADFQ